MRTFFIILAIIGSCALGGYIAIYLMLYGGIMQAINNWGINNGAVVWGIIRAIFCELGTIPAILLGTGLVWFLSDN